MVLIISSICLGFRLKIGLKTLKKGVFWPLKSILSMTFKQNKLREKTELRCTVKRVRIQMSNLFLPF